MSDSQVDLAQAEAHVVAGDLDGARAIAEAMLAADPGNAGAHNVLGFIAHRELRLLDAKREFELAGDDEDARANLATVEAQIAALGNSHADFSCTVEDLEGGLLGPDVSPRLLGLLCSQPFDEQLEARVNQLPSAASANERRFLLRFAGRLWDGDGDVFENGPLLGGTTRGLALGMLANPRRREGALLQTHDWFSSRVPLDLPPNVWEHLVEHGLVTPAHVAEMERTGSFQALFDHLHSGQAYSPLVRSHEAYLPGHRGDVPAHGEAVYRAPEGREFSLVFVDGCKSWYGTKHWLVETCQAIRPSSHVVFQDYGWYTCFWLPTLHAVLEDHFRLVAHVDDTYAFRLVRALDPATVEERFPDTPAEFGRDAFDDTFLKLGIDAGVRSDVHAMVSLTIQHAGALAYIGLLDEAREHIAGMLGRPEFFPFRGRFIAPALQSPTYTPEGPIRL